jgi:hypothetical protein
MFKTIKRYIKRFLIQRPKKLQFIVVGAQKSGTTALDHYLRNHLEIGLPEKIKELHFFDQHNKFRTKKVDYAHYHQHFVLKKRIKVYGEITPSYLYAQEVARRIYEYNPRIKIIAILRNPVDRAYSHWKMNRKQGLDTLSFEDAIAQEKERALVRLPYQDLVFSYTDRGFYSEQIRRYQRYFKDHNLHFVMYDDLKNKPEETLEKICTFLSVSPLHIPFAKVHVSEYNEPMKETTRKQLQDLYHHDILEVERLLGWNCAHWLS